LSDFEENQIALQILVKSQALNSAKNLLLEFAVTTRTESRTDGRTNGHNEANSRLSQCLANVPNKQDTDFKMQAFFMSVREEPLLKKPGLTLR
jgi:hypothetical protein